MKGIFRKILCTVTSIYFIGLSQATFANTPEAIPGEFIVKMKHSAQLQNRGDYHAAVQEALGSQVIDIISAHNMVVIKRPMIELESSALSILQQNPLVEYVEPNFIYRVNKTPNDPLLEQLWGLRNDGTSGAVGSPGVAGIDIEAEKAWDIETGSKSVIVAVIDTGVNYDHPDLKDNMWVNEAEFKGQEGVDDDNNGVVDDIHGYNSFANTGDPRDDHGHGSHCAGTIGAHGDDGVGLVGVNWNVQIMAVKFISASGSGTTANAIKAVDYATKMGAKIMSNSWGGSAESEALKEAIQKAHEKGVLFVAAAGNDHRDNDLRPTYPSGYNVPNVLSVAAIDNKGQLATFSNFGKNTVHVAAPGVKVVSSGKDDKYLALSGTSMAAPHVAGIAGLVAAHFPEMTGVEIKKRIIETARPLEKLRNKMVSNGLASAYGALSGTKGQLDPNDPFNWETYPIQIETEHPYQDGAELEFNIEIPNAQEFAFYFDKFTLQQMGDTFTIEDETGKPVSVLRGENSGTISAKIKGSKAKLKFKSDGTKNEYGIKISKVFYR